MTDHSPIAAIRSGLKADRDALRAAVDRVPAALRGTRPAPDRWSVAEVLEHLAIVEERTVAVLTPMIAGAPTLGSAAAPAATPIDRTLLRDRSQRLVAPEMIQPTGKLDVDAAWAALERTRERLSSLLDAAEGRDLTTIGRPHPRLGPLDGYQWLAAVGGHEERHAAQILELAAELEGQAAR